jgi:hypothetical protein
VTLLVGRAPDDRGPGDPALALGVRLARAWSEDLVLCTVHTAGPGGEAAGRPGDVPDDVAAVELTVVDRSVPGGLVRAARARGASAVVVGGPLQTGTVGGRLVRAADLPVALAGTRPGDGPVTRITCAWNGSPDDAGVVDVAAELARRAGASLRVAAFAARRSPAMPSEIGLDVEHEVVAGWREQTLAEQKAALERSGGAAETLAVAASDVASAVAAVGWEAGDLLVTAAPAAGAATRVLVGDRAGAVLAAAPVPAVVVPPT